MSALELVLDFLPRFLTGLQANVAIALTALGLGLALGLPLAALQQFPRSWPGRLVGRLAAGVVGVLRAAPTFVLMFFLLNALPGPWGLGGLEWRITPWASCALALACYAMAYVSDNTLDALQRARAAGPGARARSLSLLIPSLLRVFFVMVLSSGFAATVGVTEAVSVTIGTMERLPDLGQRLLILGLVMLLFTAGIQGLYAAVQALNQSLLRRIEGATKAE